MSPTQNPAQPEIPAGREQPGAVTSAAPAGAYDSVARDFQQVLSAAVQRLQSGTGSQNVTAWALRPNGEAYVAARPTSNR